jgi:hypothetical protein
MDCDAEITLRRKGNALMDAKIRLERRRCWHARRPASHPRHAACLPHSWHHIGWRPQPRSVYDSSHFVGYCVVDVRHHDCRMSCRRRGRARFHHHHASAVNHPSTATAAGPRLIQIGISRKPAYGFWFGIPAQPSGASPIRHTRSHCGVSAWWQVPRCGR